MLGLVTISAVSVSLLSGVPANVLPEPAKCDTVTQKVVGCHDDEDHGGGGGGGGGGDGEDPGYEPPERRSREECAENWERMRLCFEDPGDEEEEDDPQPPDPPFTIHDVATFAPEPGVIVGEPDNVGVAGLPANFVTDADVHTVNGELLGYPLSVRFTPVTYTFHYGDGSSRASDTAGSTWAQLDQAQFTATATSHAYAARGTYATRVDVSYTAEVGISGSWYDLVGQLHIEGEAQSIRIYEAKTALVARTCVEQPSAPGC